MPAQLKNPTLQKLISYTGIFLSLCFLLAIPASSFANMVLSDAIIHFEPGKSLRKDIEVENAGNETLYIQVEPMIVKNPGTENETREIIKDPRKAGLLVSPNKIVIPPKGRKLARFVLLKQPTDKEAVYRVTFKPISNELIAENNKVGVKIVIAYQVLVLAQPINPSPELVATRSGSTIHFKNNGNTNVLLREGKQCPSKDSLDEECKIFKGHRLYAGNEWKIDLQNNQPIEYYLSIGTKNSIKEY